MRWADDTEEAFPPRHPREPGGLRQDILDEIADHLECAAEREAECGGENDTEDAAWGRVLERFGNPDAIARKLWWDEMRDTVMREWIQTGVVVVVAIAVVVFMTLVMRQMNTANQAVLEALKSNATAVNSLVTLKVKVTRGTEEGPPAEGVEIELRGAAFGSESAAMHRPTDRTGIAAFGPMQPGQFEAFARDRKSGLRFDGSQVVTLFAGSDTETIQIVAPDVEPRLTNLEFSSPLTLGEGRALYAEIRNVWGINGSNWGGHSFAIVDGGGVRSLDPDVTDDSYRTDPGDESLWSTLTPENAPLKISGNVTSVRLALISRTASGEQNREPYAELVSSSISPSADGMGYRLELPPAFVKQFADWRVQDHAKAQGVELELGLWESIRRTYPDALVESALRVDDSKSVTRLGTSLYKGGLVAAGESIIVSCAGANISQHRVDGYCESTVIPIPTVDEIPDTPGSRVLLALFANKLSPLETDNDLQAWPVLDDVFAGELPEFYANSQTDGLAVELGMSPIGAATNEALLNRASGWVLLDVTEGILPAGSGLRPRALMLRWSHDEPKYNSSLEGFGAGLKDTVNMQLRPMWLVLKPMDGGEEVAVAQ
jgi:hypothetical protein